MDKCSRNDDTGTELLQDNEDDVVSADEVELPGQNGSENSDTAGDEDDEKKTDSKTNIVVTIRGFAYWSRASTNAVGDTSVLVTVLAAVSGLAS